MVPDWFNQTFAPYGDILFSALIVVLTILLSIGLFKIVKRYLLHVKRGEGGAYERIMSSEIKIPIYLIICSLGFYYAITEIRAIKPFIEGITDLLVIFEAVVTVYLARKIVSIIIVWFAGKDRKRIRIEKTALMSIRSIIGLFIYLIGAIIILNRLGVEITPLLASLGIGGLAIAWALQPTLTNYFAGIHLTSDKTMRLGDFIQILDDSGHTIQGYVERMSWRSVSIRTFTHNVIIIPNSKLSESTIMNYDQPRQSMNIVLPVGVAYGNDLEKVEQTAIRAAKKVAEDTGAVVEGESPFVRFAEFGDSNINFNVIFKVKSWEHQFLLKHAFIKELTKEFSKEGIEISFPCRNVYMRGK
jgi:small-conductance mechanosensitive channel